MIDYFSQLKITEETPLDEVNKKIGRLQKKFQKELSEIDVSDEEAKQKIEKKLKLLSNAKKIFATEESKQEYIEKLTQQKKEEIPKPKKPVVKLKQPKVEQPDTVEQDIKKIETTQSQKTEKKSAKDHVETIKQYVIDNKDFAKNKPFEKWMEFIKYYLIVANSLSIVSFLFLVPFNFLLVLFTGTHIFCAYLFFKKKTIFPNFYRMFIAINFVLFDIVFRPELSVSSVSVSIVAMIAYFLMFTKLSNKEKTTEFFTENIDTEKEFFHKYLEKMKPKKVKTTEQNFEVNTSTNNGEDNRFDHFAKQRSVYGFEDIKNSADKQDFVPPPFTGWLNFIKWSLILGMVISSLGVIFIMFLISSSQNSFLGMLIFSNIKYLFYGAIIMLLIEIAFLYYCWQLFSGRYKKFIFIYKIMMVLDLISNGIGQLHTITIDTDAKVIFGWIYFALYIFIYYNIFQVFNDKKRMELNFFRS